MYASDPNNRRPGRKPSIAEGSESTEDGAYSRLQQENSALRAREASARHVALEMKALADHLGEQLESERRQRTSSAADLASLRTKLEHMESAAEGRQTLLQHYSDSLTTLLADDDPSGLAPPQEE